MDTRITNAKIVTAADVVDGSLAVVDGKIEAFEPNGSGVDFDGDYLIPGLVDIHTDNLEKHFYPRPGVDWDAQSAAIIHDGQCVSVGITTVFDSLSVGSWSDNEARHLENMLKLVEGLEVADQKKQLKGSHLLHWRCETSSPVLEDLMSKLVPHRMTHLLSVMDHTPGQRQYPDIEKHKARWKAHLGLTDDEVEARVANAQEKQAKYTPMNREAVDRIAKERDLKLASHDDQLPEHIEQAVEIDATIAEFPTTLEAARLAKEHDMTVVMGAPNLMRGGSYSGNASAADIANEGLLDAFASDYVPRSMIEAAFRLTLEPFNWSLPAAIATVTSNPAVSVGLTDRGEIQEGLRADFVRVQVKEGRPLIKGVWVEGERVG
ncbi:MAG: alpha-D-ribose 1-methylphosphonate 5-triphosphate diphosphatase [Pseudomonadota bacterium]